MRTYLVLEPAGGGRDAASADDVIFLRETFSWPALFFTLLWLVWHRLWLALVGWLAALVLIGVVVYLLGLAPPAQVAALVLPNLVVAFEGSELRRRKLLRQGYRDAGVAIGKDLEDAERRFFAGWAARPAARPTPPARPSAPPPLAAAPKSVIGLFPEPGGGR